MNELLLPAGNLKKLKTAIRFGADAVYLGGKNFSLRAFADNFSEEDLSAGIEYAHSLNKKVYVTANVFARNSDFSAAKNFLCYIDGLGADAVLISDPGMLALAKSAAPNLTVHLSTQANTTNKYSARFWAEQGVNRIVLARELSLEEISEIHDYVPALELEAFVHGAMCVSYSGRCLLSSFFTDRDANRGECVQPCRWKYSLLKEDIGNTKELDIEEDARGTYFMNSRDLCLLERLPELTAAGISCFKIEGRMKSEFYLATVGGVYRRAIDEIIKNGKIAEPTAYIDELKTVSHRAYTEAFADGENLQTICYGEGLIKEEYSFVGVITDVTNETVKVEMRNRFKRGDELVLLSPKGRETFIAEDIRLADGTPTDDAKLVQHIYSMRSPDIAQTGDLLLKRID